MSQESITQWGEEPGRQFQVAADSNGATFRILDVNGSGKVDVLAVVHVAQFRLNRLAEYVARLAARSPAQAEAVCAALQRLEKQAEAAALLAVLRRVK
jgi:Zn-dependent protease with chaperone function